MRSLLNKKSVYSVQIFLIVIICALILALAYYIKKANKEHQGHYYQMTSFHFRQDKHFPPDLIYFIGDSHTQGLTTQAITPFSVNYGIGSDTTIGVLNRIHKYTSLKTAKAIFLAIGVNDLNSRDNAEISANITQIISSLPIKKPIFINTILPVSEQRFSKHLIQRIQALNNWIIHQCSKQLNIYCIDPFQQLSDQNYSLKDEFHIGDGLHLNHNGYKLWINEIKKIMLSTEVEFNGAHTLME